MFLNELICKNPLGFLETDNNEMLSPGEMGVVLARAGVGKTALLVQVALNSLLRKRNVLHISLNDPVKKVALWYDEMLRHLAGACDAAHVDQVRETVLPHRFIMTFKVEGFTVPKLEERLTDLTEQDIFTPAVVLIDGIPFDGPTREILDGLKSLSFQNGFSIWLTATTHRHEAPGPDGLPVQLVSIADLFKAAVQLQPEGKEIHVRQLLGDPRPNGQPQVILDPVTLLLKENG